MMIKVTVGNLFESKAQTWVNAVNCLGVMELGVAREFKSRFPAMYEDFAQRCRCDEVRLGEPYVYADASGRLILNFPTKGDWRLPSRLIDIEDGLAYLVKHYTEFGITSIAFPAIGCGNGGLAWADVGSRIYQALKPLPIPVELFPPPGTPADQTTIEFLEREAQRRQAP